MDKSSLSVIESAISDGRVVMAAENGIIVAAIQEAVMAGRTATFYLTRAQFEAVNSWYWTPQMIRSTGIESVSSEEKERIRSELGVEETRLSYSNRIECQCGRVYGAFEFMQQGIREHGLEAVQSVFDLKDAAIIRVNPRQQAICPECKMAILAPHYYCYWSYGCCRQPM